MINKIKKSRLHACLEPDTLLYLKYKALDKRVSISKLLEEIITIYSVIKPKLYTFLEKEAKKENVSITVVLNNMLNDFCDDYVDNHLDRKKLWDAIKLGKMV